jgi:ligand-binding sensor domain-containing protein
LELVDYTKTILFLFFCISALSVSLAQQIKFEHVTTDDGLSQNSVVSIAQDSLGFLWFATQDGLNKYDGSNFIKYEVFFKDETNKDVNQLGKIKVDSKGRIWMTTLNGGLQYCELSTEEFTSFNEISEASFVYEDKHKDIWVSSFEEGLFKLNQTDNSFEQVLSDMSIRKIIADDNDLVLISDKGVVRFDIGTKETKLLLSDLNEISDIERVEDDYWMISTFGNGLYRSRDLHTIDRITELSTEVIIQDILIDNKNRVWIASYGDGMFLIEKNRLTQFKLNGLDNKSLNYNDVLVIFQDSDGNIWFGTDGGGVSYLLDDRKQIYSLSNKDMPENIPVDVPRALSKDSKGRLWVGTSGKGLTVVDKDLKDVNYFRTEPVGNSNLSSNRIVSLFHDEDDDLWIGTQEGGLQLKKKGSIKFQSIKNDLPCRTIWDIHPVDGDNLWLCSRNEGLILFNKKSKEWKKLSDASKYEELSSGNISTIISGEKGSFYVGSQEGNVYYIDSNFTANKLDLNGGIPSPIKSLYLDNKKLWIGTQQSGIIIFDLETNSHQLVNKSNGLPNNVVYSILPQNENYVWISTNLGICQINKQNALEGNAKIVNQHLTLDNGLVSTEFNTGAYYLDNNGTMYFGGIEGINWFDPSQILKSIEPAEIILLDLIITRRNEQEVRHISNLKRIDLNHKDKNFQIKYVAQSYSKAKPQYKYKLEDFNDEWINNNENELVSFSNIPPGEYMLLLNATNPDGVWNNIPLRFGINIVPAFWQTVWFKVLSIIAFIFLLWFIYHIRVNELKRTSALKAQLSEVEAKALKLQMNPHFLFNSLNAVDNYILKNEKIKASDYLSKFSKLMRQILEYSEQSHVTLAQELHTLELYISMEQLRFQERFDYSINVHSGVNSNDIKVPPLFLQPYVENAIWHGLMHLEEGGKLNIDIIKNGNIVKCIIDDNGIGRKRAEKINSKSVTNHKSYGMRITEKRLALNNNLNIMDGSIDVIDKLNENGDPAGTSIEVTFLVQSD